MVVECVCVYFPCDNGLATDNDKFEEVLSELENFWEVVCLQSWGILMLILLTLISQELVNCSISPCRSLGWIAWILSSTLSSPLMRVTIAWPVPG